MILKLPLKRFPYLKRFSKDKSGVVALEMTLVLIPFILLFLFVAELCSVLYVSVSIDLAMAEAMRYTSSSSAPSMGVYKTTFFNKMEERIKTLPLMVYDPADISFDVKYCNSRADIADGICVSATAALPTIGANGKPVPGTGTPAAYYSIAYKYNHLFFPIPTSVLHQAMSRNGIYIMENTRVRAVP
jgi:tight adherence protein E